MRISVLLVAALAAMVAAISASGAGGTRVVPAAPGPGLLPQPLCLFAHGAGRPDPDAGDEGHVDGPRLLRQRLDLGDLDGRKLERREADVMRRPGRHVGVLGAGALPERPPHRPAADVDLLPHGRTDEREHPDAATGSRDDRGERGSDGAAAALRCPLELRREGERPSARRCPRPPVLLARASSSASSSPTAGTGTR